MFHRTFFLALKLARVASPRKTLTKTQGKVIFGLEAIGIAAQQAEVGFEVVQLEVDRISLVPPAALSRPSQASLAAQ